MAANPARSIASTREHKSASFEPADVQQAHLTLVERVRKDLECRRERNPRYSLRSYAKSLGIDHSYLSKVLRNQRSLSWEQMDFLGRKFGVQLSSVKAVLQVRSQRSSELKVVAARGVPIRRPRKPRKLAPLSEQHRHFISRWYYPVILEMSQLPGWCSDPVRISDQLANQVSVTECEEALEQLTILGLLERGPDGGLHRAHGTTLIMDPRVPDQDIREFHRQIIRRAEGSVDGLDFADRCLLTGTFSLRKKDYPKAQKILQDAVRKLSLLGRDSDGDEIYQASIQLCRATFMRQ